MTNLAHDFDWLPDPEPRTFRLFPGEIAVMRAAEDQTCSQWADGERVVHMSPLPGPWRKGTVPLADRIMVIISGEHIHHVFIAGGSQTAKTDITHNFLGFKAVTAPGPAMLVMQDRNTMTEVMQDRVIPMFRDTPSLVKLNTGNDDDLATRRIRIKNGMVVYTAWGQSEGRVASKPIRYLIMSEVDLYPEKTVIKAHARTGAFAGMEVVIEECTTSIEEARIWSAQKLAHACYWPLIRCPHCGEMQRMDPANIEWLDGVTDPAGLHKDQDAWYRCVNNCILDDYDRDQAVTDGDWEIEYNGKATATPEKVWIHNNPLCSPFVKFRKVATAYLTQLADPSDENLMFYYNDCCGLPVPEDREGETVDEKTLYERRENYAPKDADWVVPMAACFLDATVDVQGNRLEVNIIAWGPGKEGWNIEYRALPGSPGEDEVWEDLEKYLDREYLHESGIKLKIAAMGIDTGGHHADEVHKFCLKHRNRRVFALKGSSTPGKPIAPNKPRIFKREKGKKTKPRAPLYEIGTEAAKDTIFSWLNVFEEGPRYQHFPMTYDFEYFRGLCSEAPQRKRDSRGRYVKVWVVKKGYKRNEPIDLFVYNLAVLEIVNPDLEKLHNELMDMLKGTYEPPKPRRRTSNKRKRHE